MRGHRKNRGPLGERRTHLRKDTVGAVREPPLIPKKQSASGKGGAFVDRAGGPEAAEQNTQGTQSSTHSDVLASKSTTISVQLEKALVLLRQGDKTTIELRENGIMQPAARVFQLKNERKYVILTKLVTLYDAYGYRHGRCARYHLVREAADEVTQ